MPEPKHCRSVRSEFIASISFDAAARELTMVFRTGETHVYYGVPAAVYQAFLDADDPDEYYRRHVWGRWHEVRR